MNVSVTRWLMKHGGGTKFYEVLHFKLPDTVNSHGLHVVGAQHVVTRWGKVSAMFDGGQGQVHKNQSLDEAKQMVAKKRTARGYNITSQQTQEMGSGQFLNADKDAKNIAHGVMSLSHVKAWISANNFGGELLSDDTTEDVMPTTEDVSNEVARSDGWGEW